MTKTHRPWVTKHGTHCSCSVFCGSDPESWESHAFDVLVLYPEDQVDYRKLSAIEIAFRPIVVAYLEVAKQVGERLQILTRNLKVGMTTSNDLTLNEGDLVIPHETLDAITEAKERYERTPALDLKGLWEIPDQELPGMWTTSDFMGGDPDERSYAQRCRDGVHLLTNFKDNDHTANQHLKCVYCGMDSRCVSGDHRWRDFKSLEGTTTKCLRCGTRG